MEPIVSAIGISLAIKGFNWLVTAAIEHFTGIPAEIASPFVEAVGDGGKAHLDYKMEHAADQEGHRAAQAVAAAEAVATGLAQHAYPQFAKLPLAEQIALLEGIAQIDDPQQLIDDPVVQAALARVKNPKARELAEGYFRALPDHVRRTQASQLDPSGRTASAQSLPQSAAEFAAVLAAVPSAYHAGQAAPHMPGWVLEAQIGGGGFGEVWRARKRQLVCAIKFCKGGTSNSNLRMERDLIERIAQLARRTPGIVQIEDDFLDHSPPALVYEYVPGCTLETHIKARQREERPFAWAEATGMIDELAATMAVCHAAQIIHRDLKPANILLDLSEPDTPRLRITDFGIGAALDGTTGSALLGYTQGLGKHTAKYASPEQIRGERQDPRDDVHALGIIWLQLLCLDLSEDQLDGPTRRGLLKEGHPESLLELLEDSIASKAANRPASAVVLAERLAALSPRSGEHPAAVTSLAQREESPRPPSPLSASPPPLPYTSDPFRASREGLTAAGSTLPHATKPRASMDKGEFEKLAAYEASLEAQGNVIAGQFAFVPRTYRPIEQRYPLPNKIDWVPFMTPAHQPQNGLALRADEDLAAAASNANQPQPLYTRLRRAGEGYQAYEFSLLIDGQHYLLLDPVAEAKRIADEAAAAKARATLQEIIAAMVPIQPGKVKPRSGSEIVIFQPYSMCRYPVTQAWYEAVISSNSSHFKGDVQRPVEQVSWDDANAFCAKLNDLFKTPSLASLMPKGMAFALPTEAQWEYACRAGSTGDFGLLANGREGTVDQMAWYSGNSGSTTHPVTDTSKQPNVLGMKDMHGNVWEWCEDWYEQGRFRVFRGGSYFNVASVCAAGYRGRLEPSVRGSLLGFRVSLRPIQ